MGFFGSLIKAVFGAARVSRTKWSTNAAPRFTRGPVVKSGPTRGFNRSRTKQGTWRKKRT